MSWKVAVDQGTCIGSGVCAGTAPEYFELRGARSVPLRDEVDADTGPVVDAAESCPMEAILVTDSGTGETIAP